MGCTAKFICIVSYRKKTKKINHFTAGLIAFSAIQLITLLVCWLVADALPDWCLLQQLIGEDEKKGFFLRSLGISGLVSIAFLRYLFVKFQWEQQIVAKARANLDAMQARMRPHFLFNSLNTIASLTRIEPQLAEKLIEDLAELIRACMGIGRTHMVRLDEEIYLAKLYLEIELHRFDERLKINWDIANVPLDSLIPPLSLQPVIENAVYHGIELNPAGGEIIIKGSLQNSRITFTVRNTLPPAESYSNRKNNRSALNNLAARFEGCYSGAGSIFKSSADNYYQLTLAFPYFTNEDFNCRR